MSPEKQEQRPNFPLLFFSLTVLSVVACFLIFYQSPPYTELQPYPKNDTPSRPDPISAYLISLGLPTNEFDGYINQLKKDGNLPKDNISVFVGPYYRNEFIIGSIQTDIYDNYKHYLFIEKEFYDTLTATNKKAIIAHEIGHLLKTTESPYRHESSVEVSIQREIAADDFAIRYVGTDEMLDLLTKVYAYLYENNLEYQERLDNIKLLKQASLQKK